MSISTIGHINYNSTIAIELWGNWRGAAFGGLPPWGTVDGQTDGQRHTKAI
jgi:hypothetical protein